MTWIGVLIGKIAEISYFLLQEVSRNVNEKKCFPRLHLKSGLKSVKKYFCKGRFRNFLRSTRGQNVKQERAAVLSTTVRSCSDHTVFPSSQRRISA